MNASSEPRRAAFIVNTRYNHEAATNGAYSRPPTADNYRQ